MRNLTQRLAKANGMNSMLCFAAKDEIARQRKQIDELEAFVVRHLKHTRWPHLYDAVDMTSQDIGTFDAVYDIHRSKNK